VIVDWCRIEFLVAWTRQRGMLGERYNLVVEFVWNLRKTGDDSSYFRMRRIALGEISQSTDILK